MDELLRSLTLPPAEYSAIVFMLVLANSAVYLIYHDFTAVVNNNSQKECVFDNFSQFLLSLFPVFMIFILPKG